MKKPKKPNLFSEATKELSQDAFITWLLKWSDPKYKSVDSALNKIGTEFLLALIKTQDQNESQKLAEIKTVKVERQRHNIDVWVEVNDEILIIIEDKTHSGEHGGQLKTYLGKKEVKEWDENKGKVIPVYLKTGNECISTLHGKPGWHPFTRQDFLIILPANSNNHIVADFTEHLKDMEKKTNEYTSKPVDEWKENWYAIQGFYCDLQKGLKESDSRRNNGHSEWSYVPNPAGGFFGLYWHYCDFEPVGCEIYLQIESNPENGKMVLVVKASAAKDEKDPQRKLETSHMYQIYESLLSTAKQKDEKLIKIEKAGRFVGGRWVSIARLTQPNCRDGQYSSIFVNEKEKVDMKETIDFLSKAEKLITSMCEGEL